MWHVILTLWLTMITLIVLMPHAQKWAGTVKRAVRKARGARRSTKS